MPWAGLWSFLADLTTFLGFFNLCHPSLAKVVICKYGSRPKQNKDKLSKLNQKKLKEEVLFLPCTLLHTLRLDAENTNPVPFCQCHNSVGDIKIPLTTSLPTMLVGTIPHGTIMGWDECHTETTTGWDGVHPPSQRGLGGVQELELVADGLEGAEALQHQLPVRVQHLDPLAAHIAETTPGAPELWTLVKRNLSL